jgi:putative spermidine/putrescine transport system ATP-binding protein
MLEVRSVRKAYGGVAALDDISLSVRGGEYLSMLGPSGSGKSTLLRVIAGFEAPEAGDIALNGRSLTGVPPHERAIGFVSQGFALFPHLSVFDNVAFGLRYRQVKPVTSSGEVKRRVDEMLDLVGLGDLGGRQIGQISGGQKQRVALARTLVVEPKVCLLDEPLGALDANLRQRMTIELRRLHQRLGIVFVHVTGNEIEALAMGDRVVVLDRGRIIQIDEPDNVYNRPATVDVARFLNRYNMLDTADMATGGGTCCIRRDRIEVRAPGPPHEADEASIEATYVTAEYSGAEIVYFFRLASGKVVEVEFHLSHQRPQEFREGAPYVLVWPASEALSFAPQPVAA